MRLNAVLIACLLSGCAFFKGGSGEVPPQPVAPTKADNMAAVGDQIDKSDSRVAAAVTVAQRNADKPEVVKAETSVALAYLPKPNEGDVAFAEARAARNDAKEYEAARDYGRKLLARIDANWAKMEADQAEAQRVSKIKDARITELVAEVDRVKREASRNIWTLTGAGLVVAGAIACAFASVRVGLGLLVGGAFAGSVPYILDSVWFPWVAGSVIVGLSILGGVIAWERFVKPSPEATAPDGPEEKG